MKVTSVSLALVGSVMAAGGADTVNQVLTQIASDLKDFHSAIKAYSGDASQMVAASKKIETTTTAGASQIAGGADLSLTDAVGITSNVQSLQTTLDGALSDLKAIGEKLAAAGQCSTIIDQLGSQEKSAQALQDAITSKAPVETKAVAQQLGGAIGSSLKDTDAYFAKTCANAPSGGASSGGAAADHAGMAGMGGSQAPASGSSPSPASAGSSGSKSGGKASKTSSVPKPATYTGAASALTAPFLGAFLAFFAL